MIAVPSVMVVKLSFLVVDVVVVVVAMVTIFCRSIWSCIGLGRVLRFFHNKDGKAATTFWEETERREKMVVGLLVGLLVGLFSMKECKRDRTGHECCDGYADYS
jgi:hypothetical protein